MFALKTALGAEPHFVNAMAWRGEIPMWRYDAPVTPLIAAFIFSSALHFFTWLGSEATILMYKNQNELYGTVAKGWMHLLKYVAIPLLRKLIVHCFDSGLLAIEAQKPEAVVLAPSMCS